MKSLLAATLLQNSYDVKKDIEKKLKQNRDREIYKYKSQSDKYIDIEGKENEIKREIDSCDLLRRTCQGFEPV